MVINTHLQCLQNRRFAMIATADKKRDALLDPHTGDRTVIWESNGYLTGCRTLKRHSTLHRAVRDSAFSRKHRAVCKKCCQSLFTQMLPDKLLVTGKLDRRLQCIFVKSVIKQCDLRCLRHKLKQHFNKLPCIDTSPVRRKACLKPNRHRAVCRHLTGGALKHLLSAVRYR